MGPLDGVPGPGVATGSTTVASASTPSGQARNAAVVAWPVCDSCPMELSFQPLSVASLHAELSCHWAELSGLLGASVEEWPPLGGEWDQDAMRFFLELARDPGWEPAWGPMYVTSVGRLVASAGFFGPPDADGEVEIGYSVCGSERRKGIATVVVARLCEFAEGASCRSVRARTRLSNVGSVRTLERNGFVHRDRGGEANDSQVVFWRALAP